MTALLLTGLLAAQGTEAPRTLERLSNGSLLYVERMESADRVSVQLWISARGTEERLETNGRRHLLEHFLAKAQDKFCDESGVFMSAETTREAMAFKVEASPQKLSFAVQAVKQLFQPLKITQAEIDREVATIRHEEALTPVARQFSRTAWARIFGGLRPDPLGDPEVMRTTTPEMLESLRKRMFASSNIVITACGSITPSAVLRDLSPFLLALPPAPPSMTPADAAVTAPALSVGAQGVALAVKVDGLEERETMGVLALSFAADQAFPDVQLMYTPSSLPGLVMMVSSERGMVDRVRGMSDRQLQAGIVLAQRWVAGIQQSPSRLASLRGAMLAEGSGLQVQTLERSAKSLTPADMTRAMDEIRQCPVIEGLQ